MPAPKRDQAGFYSTPYGTFRSVTTSLKFGCPKESLVHWAAAETARSALDNLPYLAKVRGEAAHKKAFEFLRRAPETRRDNAADFGSAVHKVIEADVFEAPMPDITPEQEPFVEAYRRFRREFSPEFEAVELTVVHPEAGYAGTADFYAYMTLEGKRALVLGDWKTGKGVYKEAALQLSAYIRAPIGFLRDGTEVTPPSADRAVVVHLRPEVHKRRGYKVIPVDTSDEHYEQFLHAQEVAKYTLAAEKDYLGKAITPPVTPAAA